jgi:1,4-dihydroxy-2-naphthoate octaprenyltransferase
MLEGSEKQLTNWQVWVLAARPKTLPAAAAPVLVGSAAALVGGGFHLGVFCAALLAALLLQVGANLANDVFDFHKGADAHQRLGPTRVTQAGLLLPEQVYRGMWLVFGVASLLGLYLIWMAGWPILVIGVASILAAIAYTGGPFPFGYYGLGEFFVFLFFGLAAVCGTYYAHLHSLDILAIVSSLPMGFLITAILVVNNLRDIETDRLAGKRTLAVRLKVPGTRVEFLLLIIAAYTTSLVMWLTNLSTVWIMLSWLSLPLAISMIQMIWKVSGRPLNLALAGTGRLTLIYAVLFSLGLIIPLF